ncbi:chlorite dismutase family protein [bacterium AH-315-I18]|nr:chlorite dismutase family protein [Phycisphaeraceae bacterium]MBN4061170.1 chlorite dismutase family protein [bacterium AH-315-I18]
MRPQRPTPPKPDIAEHGSPINDQPQVMDRRLFVQLLVFTDCTDSSEVVQAMEKAGIVGAVYEDLHDANGIAILALHEDPNFFVTTWRNMLKGCPFDLMTHLPDMTMFGRTYSIGYEPNLQEVLFDRPVNTATNPKWPWAIWYPLRRKGEFNKLSAEEQRAVLMEHGTIGMAFGGHDLAHDIRLSCHGLDRNDNDFVLGLLGKDLHPLSALVQTMRKTKQTSELLQCLGPFFVGKAIWQSKA